MEISNCRFIEQVKDNGYTYYDERFEAGVYNIYFTKVTASDGRVVIIDIQALTHEQYYPEIRYKNGSLTRNERFGIQTTSWGSLTTDEIEKVIEGYNTALKMVEYLKERYDIKEVI